MLKLRNILKIFSFKNFSFMFEFWAKFLIKDQLIFLIFYEVNHSKASEYQINTLSWKTQQWIQGPDRITRLKRVHASQSAFRSQLPGTHLFLIPWLPARTLQLTQHREAAKWQRALQTWLHRRWEDDAWKVRFSLTPFLAFEETLI